MTATISSVDCLSIGTSRVGLLWPLQYWKCLIDAVTLEGAKKNPKSEYADIQFHSLRTELNGKGRVKCHLHERLHKLSDSLLSAIQVERVVTGKEYLKCQQAQLPSVDRWSDMEGYGSLSVEWFRTIGARKYEGESKQHRESIQNRLENIDKSFNGLQLAFELRKDRKRPVDLDNLVDAVITPFSRHFTELLSIECYKLPPKDGRLENLYFIAL
jgi:hypothetical protein